MISDNYLPVKKWIPNFIAKTESLSTLNVDLFPDPPRRILHGELADESG